MLRLAYASVCRPPSFRNQSIQSKLARSSSISELEVLPILQIWGRLCSIRYRAARKVAFGTRLSNETVSQLRLSSWMPLIDFLGILHDRARPSYWRRKRIPSNRSLLLPPHENHYLFYLTDGLSGVHWKSDEVGKIHNVRLQSHWRKYYVHRPLKGRECIHRTEGNIAYLFRPWWVTDAVLIFPVLLRSTWQYLADWQSHP